MIVKTNYDKEIEILKEIADHYSNDAVGNALETITELRDNFELKILVVGHFNAGKSSLINTFIGRKGFLAEDQGETTALAAELRYAKEEKAFSYDKRGNKNELIIGKTYLPTEYDHLTFFMNEPSLEMIEDFVLVDTPGFDTAIEDHTRALTSYLKYGVGFIMVIDVEKGGIDSQTLDYLHEISQYSQDIVLLINKCDKQLDEEVEKVVALSKSTLEQSGFDYPVYTISKFDSDIVKKISSIILNINAQEKYDEALGNTVISNAKVIRETLKLVAENQFLDTFEYDDCIRIQERNKELAQKTFERKRKELTDNIDNEVEEVINAVKAALSSKAHEAAYAIERGSADGLQSIIIDTVRPVLIQALKNFSADSLAEISHSLKITFDKTKNEEKGLDEVILSIGEKIHGLMENGTFIKNEKSPQKEDAKKSDAGNSIYKLVTVALSLTTSAVAPWMEAVIILLPEIVAGLKYLFGESNHSKIVKQYESEIIPKVTNSLWSSVRESYTENVNTLIALFEEELGKSMDSVNELLKTAREQKAKSIEDYNAFKKQLEEDIKNIDTLLEE